MYDWYCCIIRFPSQPHPRSGSRSDRGLGLVVVDGWLDDSDGATVQEVRRDGAVERHERGKKSTDSGRAQHPGNGAGDDQDGQRDQPAGRVVAGRHERAHPTHVERVTQLPGDSDEAQGRRQEVVRDQEQHGGEQESAERAADGPGADPPLPVSAARTIPPTEAPATSAGTSK
jgi:hypothetical protein